jgi:hypothetical protein
MDIIYSMKSLETLGPGFIGEGGISVPYLEHPVVVTKMPAGEPVQSRKHSVLEGYLVYVVPSVREDEILPFSKHLRSIKGKLKVGVLGSQIGMDHSVLSRLLNLSRNPTLATVVRITEGFSLSDEQVYKIVTDAATIGVETDACRWVFSDDAPALEGTMGEQFEGYMLAKGVSQRVLAGRIDVNHSILSKIVSPKDGKVVIPAFITFANFVTVLGLNARQVRGLLSAVPLPVKNS